MLHRFSADAAAPDARALGLRFAGTIGLNQPVNRTIGRTAELALISHYEIEIASHGACFLGVVASDSASIFTLT